MTCGSNALSLTFSPDSKFLAVGNLKGQIAVWNIADRSIYANLRKHEQVVDILAFSPDGRTLASNGDNNSVTIWDIAAKASRIVLGPHEECVAALAFAPDGKSLATLVRSEGIVRLWNIADGSSRVVFRGAESKFAFEWKPELDAIAFSLDGTTLAISCWGEVILWDAASEQERYFLRSKPFHASRIAYAPNGKFLAVDQGGYVLVWDVRTLTESARLKHPESPVGAGFVHAFAFSGDCRVLGIAWGGGTGQPSFMQLVDFDARRELEGTADTQRV